MSNVATKFSWVIPTTNADGSAIVPGEITGFNIGVRPAAGGAAGTYPTIIPVSDPTATSANVALSVVPGAYIAAVETIGPTDSPWSAEAPFTVVAILPVPRAPTNFSAA